MKKIPRKNIIRAAAYPGLFLLAAGLLFPVFWMLVSSLQPSSKLMRLPPEFIPQAITLANFTKIFQNAKYVRYFFNSFVIAIGTVAVVLAISLPAGYAFSRFDFLAKKSLLSAITSVQMFPVVVILITLYTFYMRWRLLDTYTGVILADTTFALPLAITLMRSFFDTVPRSLDESARMDGAGRLRTLFTILVPLTKPGLVAVGIYTFLNSWDDFLMALTIIQDQNKKTITVGLAQSFLGEYAYDYGALMAFSLVGSLPVVLLFIFLQRYMIEGLTAGAVKG